MPDNDEFDEWIVNKFKHGIDPSSWDDLNKKDEIDHWLEAEVRLGLIEEAAHLTKRTELPWSVNPFTRCRATLEPGQEQMPYFGRCELRRRHQGYHALERGFNIVLFATVVIASSTEY